jgi:hypothetical protein
MYKEMAAHESTRNTKLSDKKRLTRDEVDGISPIYALGGQR